MDIEPVNIFTVDLEDWYLTDDYLIDKSRFNEFERNLIQNTEIILELLKVSKNKATFFVLGKIAEMIPSLVNEIISEGHEIASHGYNHKLISAMSPEEFKIDIEKTNCAINDATGIFPVGYRAPYFVFLPWMIEILRENGLKYDSSINIRWLNKWKDVVNTVELGQTNNFSIFPIQNYNIFGMNIPNCGGGYFRLYPYKNFKALFDKSINPFGMRIFYIHPWDICNSLDKKQIKLLSRFKNFYNTSSTINKLERLMEDYRFNSFREYLEK
jgi:polysaccharide deacetylase family protein (PEP-CTERM system associated)